MEPPLFIALITWDCDQISSKLSKPTKIEPVENNERNYKKNKIVAFTTQLRASRQNVTLRVVVDVRGVYSRKSSSAVLRMS